MEGSCPVIAVTVRRVCLAKGLPQHAAGTGFPGTYKVTPETLDHTCSLG